MFTKKNKFFKADIKLMQDKALYKGFFSMREWTFKHRLFQGGWSEPVKRELLARDNAVGALLYDPKQDRFVLVEQLRVGALEDDNSPWLLEIVAGMVEPGEIPEQVAVRESMEEAGCQVQKLLPMFGYWVSPGGTTEYVDLFLAIVDSSNAPSYAGLDTEHEDIKVQLIDRATLLGYLEQGYLNNAMTILSLQWFLLNEHKIKDVIDSS